MSGHLDGVPSLTETERRRLVGVLGRLGSDHAGERAAAGLLADRMVRAAGLSWEDIVPGAGPENGGGCISDWLDDLAFCGRHADALTVWERQFVGGVARSRSPSPKQIARLAQMAAGLRAQGCR